MVPGFIDKKRSIAMSKKAEQSELEHLVRRHGVPQAPKVDPLESEVRSCIVASHPRPVKGDQEGVLGGIVEMSEFSLPLGDVQEFHEFLRQNEKYVTDSLNKAAPGALYLGTYMLYGPGNPHYRTVWAYESLEVMGKAWSKALQNRSSNFYKAVRQLRAYWLRDPERTEARWVPARFYFNLEEDLGDAFAKLTLDADKLNSARRRP
jgi:hypothetical protein